MSGSILVVDDDLKVLDILKKSLTRHGHDVHVASTGEEALRSYRKQKPDLMLLDLILPDMDGRDIVKILGSVPEEKLCPVVFVSASADPDIMENTFDIGAQDYIQKPFSLREVNAKVKRTLINSGDPNAKPAANGSESADYERVNKELKRQLLSMRTLFSVSQDLNRRLDVDEMVNRLALTVVGELRISSIAVFLLERDKNDYFTLKSVKGFDRGRVADLEISAAGGFSRWLLEIGRPHKLVRGNDQRWVQRLPDLRLAIFEYVAPMIVDQQLRGIVFTGPKLGVGSYTRSELNMLQTVCNSASTGIDNARLFHELQDTYLSTVKTLVSIVEAKDAYTRGHTERVADYSVALATKMKLAEEYVRTIAFGATLHDIGKLVVFERILNKPDELSSNEWEEIRKHPQTGARIIENMAFLTDTVPLVLHHHEWYDGNGYPHGLKGEHIPLGARIIAVADCFDAMTTDRPYRESLGRVKALETLEEYAGTQFDPIVVQHFVELIRKHNYHPRKTYEFQKL